MEVENVLTIDCLIAKIVGLTAILCVGIPLGKEAAFIHIAAILAHLLSSSKKCKDTFSHEMKRKDVLVSASAVGFATSMVSPIGGKYFIPKNFD